MVPQARLALALASSRTGRDQWWDTLSRPLASIGPCSLQLLPSLSTTEPGACFALPALSHLRTAAPTLQHVATLISVKGCFFSRLLSVSGQAEAEKAGTFPTPFYCFYLFPQLAPVEDRVGARQQREFDPQRHIQQLRTSCSELLSSAPGLERQRRSWAFGPPSQEPSCRALTGNAL